MAPRAAELFSLKGKTAFVTGASQGLGRRFAIWLAAEGANVVLAARNVANLEQVAAEIGTEGGSAKVVPLDLTKDDSTLSAVETAWNAFEGGVDIVVNNSGIGNFGPCLDLTTEAFDEVITINLRGAFVVSREFAKRMVAAGKRGSIINVSSAAGDGALMWGVPYCASKAAMNHMTRTMARELGPKGIRVNALAPGYIITDINTEMLNSPMGEHMASTIPLRRFGDIEKDLHGALLLLASDAGAYMTGSVVVVDGGVIMGTVTSFDPDWKDPA